MEDILTYIIVFGLIIGGFAFWQFRYSKPRPYILSQQIFPELDLQLLIEKSEGKTKDFLININLKKHLLFKYPYVELLNKKRDAEIVLIHELISNKNQNNQPDKEKNIQYKYSFSEFSDLLKKREFKFKTFRIIVENNSGKKFKSHELAFNKNWIIYRPDSGKYN